MKSAAAVKIDATDHARCSASSAERWMHCAGSVGLAGQSPQTTSFAAAQGTLAHAIAARCLSPAYDMAPVAWLGYKALIEGHEIECDAEMVDGVQLYIDTINDLKLDRSWVEMSLADALQKWHGDLGGTADYVTYSPQKKLLRVVDFKYGAGVFVDADDNKQLKVYALGAMLTVNVPVDFVEVYIVQPRYEDAEPVRKEGFPAYDLMEFAGDIAEAAEATRQPNAPLTPGSWCAKTFCPNARTCPALEGMQHALMKQEFSTIVPADPKALGQLLTAVPLVKERIKAIEEFAYMQATAGTAIPGFKLVEKRGRRQWTDEPAVMKWAKDRAIEPYEEPELKSPAQLEKGLKKAEKAELAQFTVSVSSGTALVPDTDVRPAVSKQITVDDFTAIDGAPKQLTVTNLFE